VTLLSAWPTAITGRDEAMEWCEEPKARTTVFGLRRNDVLDASGRAKRPTPNRRCNARFGQDKHFARLKAFRLRQQKAGTRRGASCEIEEPKGLV